MIDRVISWCIANRFLVLASTIAIALWGAWAMRHVPVDAVPDASDVQVIVATEWPGRSPDLIEAQVTGPLVASLVATPGVHAVRGITQFGVSFVHLIFDDATDIYWARSRVTEQLRTVERLLPDGVTPTLSPDATAVGWVFQYAVVDESGNHSLDELRSLQDWTIRYALSSVPGVAEVASIGGFVKQYQVNLNPARLLAFNLSPTEIGEAIRASNADVEGQVLESGGRESMVRAVGHLTSVEDIKQIALRVTEGATPVTVGDVADVRIGPESRRSVADLDGRGEVVGGIVIMRSGASALDVIERVKARLAELKSTLPASIQIVPVYDRTTLIRGSFRTLRRLLIEEIAIVSLVVIAFLFNFRAAVVPVVALPVAVLASFIPLWYFGITADTMSLGGIALAIGVLVDAAIVMVENGFRSVAENPAPGPVRETASAAAHQVGRPVFFSLAVIVVSFLPVFLLESQEGRMFRPLALTKTVGVTVATVLGVTLVPAMMVLLLRQRGTRQGWINPVTRACMALYEPVLRFALRRRTAVLLLNAVVIPIALFLALRLGHEFMPPLYEGSLLYMPSAPTGLAVSQMARVVQAQDRVIAQFPEVARVFGTAGRATTATDNSPMGMVNTIITLKPREEWRPGVVFDTLQSEMDAALQTPGFSNTWTQPIRSRIDMLATGIKTPVGIKILGSDVSVIQALGLEIEKTLRDVPGTRMAYAERLTDGSFTDIRIDRAAIARYGLTIEDVENVIQIAIGGKTFGRTIEGRERYPISVRYQRDFRSDLTALQRLPIKTAAGVQVPLGQLAAINVTTGPAMIRSENGMLAGYVYVDPGTRDAADYVSRARDAIAARVKLPAGYMLAWSGQYEHQTRAAARLRVIVPAVLFAVFVLLYLTFRSGSEAVVVMLSVVYAMTGGVLMQWFLGYRFSVAVWIGYITLYGVAVQTGIIMVMYLHEALDRTLRSAHPLTESDLYDATVKGAVLRLRPKLMTVFVTILGLMPILWSSGIGSDILKPIAAPIVGGMVTSAIHVLIITPVLFYLMKRRALRRGTLQPA